METFRSIDLVVVLSMHLHLLTLYEDNEFFRYKALGVIRNKDSVYTLKYRIVPRNESDMYELTPLGNGKEEY